MIIIGIDPGTATTGYGIIKCKKEAECLDYGVIKTSSKEKPKERLREIFNKTNNLIKKYNPRFLAVENVYFFKNAKTAIPVGQAKGVILLVAARKKIKVYEFTPLQIKMTITGYGKAKKKQVQKMIKKHLNLKEVPKPNDAADALGAAFCCHLQRKNNPKMKI